MNYTIQFWRYFFTCMICMLHFESIYFDGEQPVFACGYLAVEFFFILSGFFMCKHISRHDESAWDYTLSRIKRFYPHLMICWGLLILNAAVLNKWNIISVCKEIKKHIWEYLLLNATGVTWDILNGPTWYISALLIAGYFIYWLLKNRKKEFMSFIAPLLILFIYSYYAMLGKGLDYHLMWARLQMGSINRALGGLCIGCLTFNISEKYFDKIVLSKIQKIGVNVLEVVVIIGIADIMLYGQKNSNNLLVLFLFPLLILFEYNGWTLLSRILNNKIAKILGNISLTIYLNQVLIIGIYLRYCDKKNYALDALKFLLIITIVGLFIWEITKWFEKRWKIFNGQRREHCD